MRNYKVKIGLKANEKVLIGGDDKISYPTGYVYFSANDIFTGKGNIGSSGT